ncbi:MAG: hypothetical protein ACI9G1_002279 [Pirellulaceae bacterium]|jgi:hypothetical protein
MEKDLNSISNTQRFGLTFRHQNKLLVKMIEVGGSNSVGGVVEKIVLFVVESVRRVDSGMDGIAK